MSGHDRNNPPIPSREKLTKALAIAELNPDGAAIKREYFEEILEAAKWALHAIPDELDFISLILRHPINQVYFRAGLLACREYMARFVEQGGDKAVAQSIRANWWPILGDDPGPPRLFNFAELVDEIEHPDGRVTWKSKDVSPSIEALPHAFHFLQHLPAKAKAESV